MSQGNKVSVLFLSGIAFKAHPNYPNEYVSIWRGDLQIVLYSFLSRKDFSHAGVKTVHVLYLLTFTVYNVRIQNTLSKIRVVYIKGYAC